MTYLKCNLSNNFATSQGERGVGGPVGPKGEKGDKVNKMVLLPHSLQSDLRPRWNWI